MNGYKKTVKMSYDEAIKKVKEELTKEGFGVLTEIDIKATLKKKLDVDYNEYIILGACNPPAAYKALQEEPDIGLLLPCNIIVYEKDDVTTISAVKPSIAMQMIQNAELNVIAKKMEQKLKKVIDNV